ncbi:Uncharacterised protein [uncultured archaeon]|nr:Uncharacterised protein [uncultured archaeon]
MRVTFSNHAKNKFKVFERHGFKITETNVLETVENPTDKSRGRKGRLIMQRPFDKSHVLRVICEAEGDDIKVITFYPARKERYEN